MTKQHFIALADMIKECNKDADTIFNTPQIDAIADFCQSQNSNFKRDRWLDYIAGKCGKNGGAVKKAVNA